MFDILKKTILAGIGATVTTKEKIEEKLETFVEKGKITSQEAREVADKIVEEGREEFEKAKMETGKLFEELLGKANLASRKELAALEARVAKLEESCSPESTTDSSAT